MTSLELIKSFIDAANNQECDFPLNNLPFGEKFALAGSISEGNVSNLSKLGVNFFDLSSSLESQLGYKDHQKIKSFIQKINELKS